MAPRLSARAGPRGSGQEVHPSLGHTQPSSARHSHPERRAPNHLRRGCSYHRHLRAGAPNPSAARPHPGRAVGRLRCGCSYHRHLRAGAPNPSAACRNPPGWVRSPRQVTATAPNPSLDASAVDVRPRRHRSPRHGRTQTYLSSSWRTTRADPDVDHTRPARHEPPADADCTRRRSGPRHSGQGTTDRAQRIGQRGNGAGGRTW